MATPETGALPERRPESPPYVNPSLIGDTGKPLVEMPPLASLAERARFRLLDATPVGEDLRLRLRPVA